MRTFLTAGDVSELIGLTPTRFRSLRIACGILPIAGGQGRGNHRQYNAMQVVGIVVTSFLRETPRGCCDRHVGEIVAAFGKMKEEDLLQGFALGLTRFWRITPKGHPLLIRSDDAELPDVQQIHASVRSRIARLSKANAKPTGRKRGLARRPATKQRSK